MELLDFLVTENDLETDGENLSIRLTDALTGMCKEFSFLWEIVSHHNPSDGNEWSDILTRIAGLYPHQKEKHWFYLMSMDFVLSLVIWTSF